MSGERVACLEAALTSALRADELESSSRTRRAISLIRLEIQGVWAERGIGPVQGRLLTALVDDGPQTEADLRSGHPRVPAILGALLARGLVEAVRREGQPCLWRATGAGWAWVERGPA